ncbi:hypothetical protein AEST_25340 [Alishewanella aestuarii B11]|uniref:DUF1887 domain-containing protein n=1 Tax=Alishewanella aestuarii B11 TaxID=1197174 RepID=J1QGG7_9ALTE|nr:DUF1887 family protein [Alishewanella aestuarii]EJI84601.1 hypothetical protein AEST_25340 [Alishewanella aestuarii B11]
MAISPSTALLIPISDHNIAQLYNCLAADYQTVVLLASKHFWPQRSRFIAVINSIKPDINLIEANLPEDAENYQALSAFVQHELLQKTQGYQLELNSTGGTKVIPIVLLDLLPIKRVYYKGVNHNYLQSWQPGQPLSYQQIPLTSEISAEQALKLYIDKMDLAADKTDPYSMHEQAINIATEIWQQYLKNDSAMHWLVTAPETATWAASKLQEAIKLTIPKQHQQNTAWQNWFTTLAAFSQGQLSYQHPTLTLYSHKSKKHPANQFKRWLSGDWLEQLVQSWLSEKLPNNQLLFGVKPSTTGEQGANRELDFICFHNTAGYVIETKVTTAPDQTPNKMVQQLVSLAENFGKLKKVLLLSPLFFLEKDDINARQQFEEYCKSHHVTLCRDKAELLALFK